MLEKKKVFIPVEAKDYTHTVFVYTDDNKIERISVEEQEGYFFTFNELMKFALRCQINAKEIPFQKEYIESLNIK